MSPAPLELIALAALAPDEASAIASALASMDPWRALGYGAEVLEGTLVRPHPDLTRYLAQRNGETLGLAVVRHPWLRGAYIELFAVLPGAQGQGLGKALLNHIEAVHRGRTGNLWLLASGFNLRARRFYAAQGFVEIGPIPNLVVAGEDEILMRKVLTGAPRD